MAAPGQQRAFAQKLNKYENIEKEHILVVFFSLSLIIITKVIVIWTIC